MKRNKLGQKIYELEQINQYFLEMGLDLPFLEDVKKIIDEGNRYLNIQENFNYIFIKHGWFASKEMSVQLMEEAIEIFNDRGITPAEDYLCEKFDDRFFDLHSHRLRALFVWKDSERERLLKLAYEDHVNERYHASIPVVLMQLDGLSQDMVNRDFTKINQVEGTKGSEISLISEIIGKARTETRSNPIMIPYRHGILHGRDTNYANRYVSTKCFFALFGFRPWALDFQNSEFDRQSGKREDNIPRFRAGKQLEKTIAELRKMH